MTIHSDTAARAIGSDVFFSDSVKAVQARRGSRANYARMAEQGAFQTTIGDDLAGWLAERDSFYLATASASGQPYIQHRGGPPGFIHVTGPRRIAFADFRGNRQYITLGNLAENDQAMMFVMDYEQRMRIKIWGRARVVEDDAELLARLTPKDYKARPEQVIVFEVDVWDANCPQHIPQKVKVTDVAQVVMSLKQRIAALESEVAALRGATP